jgi:hypothetical protein
MKSKLKKVASTPFLITNHVKRHKGTYFMGGIALALLTTHVRTLDAMNEFLIEKGIDPNEFFLTPEDFAALQS